VDNIAPRCDDGRVDGAEPDGKACSVDEGPFVMAAVAGVAGVAGTGRARFEWEWDRGRASVADWDVINFEDDVIGRSALDDDALIEDVNAAGRRGRTELGSKSHAGAVHCATDKTNERGMGAGGSGGTIGRDDGAVGGATGLERE
jgi:hypothetical protein